jgi:hypothetical protein
VDKAFLEKCLGEGLSLEAIGKRVGSDDDGSAPSRSWWRRPEVGAFCVGTRAA